MLFDISKFWILLRHVLFTTWRNISSLLVSSDASDNRYSIRFYIKLAVEENSFRVDGLGFGILLVMIERDVIQACSPGNDHIPAFAAWYTWCSSEHFQLNP